MGNNLCRPAEAELDKRINGYWYKAVFPIEKYGEGACRVAFKGEYKGDGRLDGKECVTKVFIKEANRYYSRYEPDLKASQKARELAEEFNSRFLCKKPLQFMLPQMATVTRIPTRNEFVSVGDKILVEDFIEGDYEKFNSNGGWETDSVAAIPAFSHFTYWETGGAFLVCDVQGVRGNSYYKLTDPAVHSRIEGQFGPTDLGPSGMSKFFYGHTCNSVCKQFPMPDFNTQVEINPGRRMRHSSSYSFMLTHHEHNANKIFKNRDDLPAISE